MVTKSWPWERRNDSLCLPLDDKVEVCAISSSNPFYDGYEVHFIVRDWLAYPIMAARGSLDDAQGYIYRQVTKKLRDRGLGAAESSWESQGGPWLNLNGVDSTTVFYIKVDPQTGCRLLILYKWGWIVNGVVAIQDGDADIEELKRLGEWERSRLHRAVCRFFNRATPEIEEIDERPVLSDIKTPIDVVESVIRNMEKRAWSEGRESSPIDKLLEMPEMKALLNSPLTRELLENFGKDKP